MKPILLDLGAIKIHAYGLALALAFLVGSMWTTHRGSRQGYREDDLMRLFGWILVSSLIGARLYYALQHPADFDDDWLAVARVWQGGLTQYGGLIAAILVGGLFIRSRRWSFLDVSDLLAPALALGEAITRIGCFFNGCCFGEACTLPWAVVYPEGSHAHWVLGETPVHPSPLYLCIANLLLFLLLRRLGALAMRSGRLFAIFIAGSSAVRFLIDFTRYYGPEDRITIGTTHLAHSQWLSLVFFAAAVALWFLAPDRAKAASS